MRIKATLHYMADSEILSMISEEKLKEIKAKDPKPLFKAFVIGHEGTVSGKIVGMGKVVNTWYQSGIEKLHEKIKAGIQLFHGHSDTNDNTGRISIGEIAGKALNVIDDKLSSIVACWIHPSFRHLPLDVASIEADVAFDQDKNNGLYVTDVGDVSGVALGNSKINTPGFPGATLLGTIQAFVNKTQYTGETMTPEEIKKAILEAGLQPSDIFTKEGLTADPLIMEHVKEKSHNPEGFQIRKLSKELAEAEKKAAQLELEKKELEGKVKKYDDDIKTLKSENVKVKIADLFESEKTKRNLEDEKAIKYIQARLPRFIAKNPDELEKEFSDYLDAEVDEFKKISKDVFGIEEKKDDKGGAEPDNKGLSEIEDEYLDPEKNELIQR